MKAGRHGDAADAFLALTRIDPDSYSDHELGFEKRLFGELAFAALGNCYFHMGDYGTSAAFYGRAAAADPGSLEYRAKAVLAESRAAARR
jgi:tetratricopeptide (TPR) repeat protein